jgi:hypothetical protein
MRGKKNPKRKGKEKETFTNFTFQNPPTRILALFPLFNHEPKIFLNYKKTKLSN